ncbi:MAG: DUF1302 family protein [Pseudomonadota bacterium]
MKNKSMFFMVIVTIAAALFLNYATEVIAGESLLGDKVSITGFIENQTALRLENGVNDDYQLSRMRNTLQVEGAVNITDWLKFNTIARGYFDAVYELDHTINDSPKHRAKVPEGRHNESLYGDRNMEQEVDLREYYFRAFFKNSTLKIGRQQIVWGEADLFRMSDIINPLDLSAGGTFVQDLENVRVPLRAIDFVHEVPNQHGFKIELVAIPEDFRPNTLSAPGGNWDPFYATTPDINLATFAPAAWPPPPLILAPLNINWNRQDIANALIQGMERDLNDFQDDSHFQGGARLRARFGDWDGSMFYYYSRAQDAVMTLDRNAEALVEVATNSAHPAYNPTLIHGIAAIGPSFVGSSLHFYWPKVQNIGITFNVPESLTDSIIRFESAYTIDQPFTVDSPNQWVIGMQSMLDPSGLLIFPDTEYTEKDVFAYMIGFDRPTFISALNRDKTFFISGQLYQKFVINAADGMKTGLGREGYSKQQTMVTLLINSEYFDGRITPEVLGAYDFSAKAGLTRATLTYSPTYRASIALGGIWLYARENTAAMVGPFQRDDEIFLHLKYTF